MTTNCNFNCKYCYQSQAKEISVKPFKINSIKENTIDSIIKLIKENIKERKPKIFSVTFWGGEPLLEKEKIKNLSWEIKKICEKEKIEYDPFIITNGYLLDKKTIEEFKNSGINKLIITLDGTKEEHDRLRVLKNGKGTFEKIYENIKIAAKELFVKIRINVFPHNIKSIKMLIDKIAADKLKVEIDLRQGEMADNNKLKSFTIKEFAKMESELYNYIIEKLEYYNFNPFLKINQARCDAPSKNSLVIDADGKLYKCWGEIGGISKEIGELKENGQLELNYRKNIWLAIDPFDEECKNCKVLPYCMGGCILGKVLAEKYGVIEYGRERCLPIKYNLEEMVLLTEKTYRRRKNGIRK
ncbi:radical SAM/SPASM domain-containing protein [Marinitoga lauensis]|uniref:radical SAM/SPASM domain-containing protein n=1 Tax=Marinitoga lauensis TaxID=2201189 RepID=UPI001010A49D|nr:radical SAM protein [Marinitoga lauensis]